jgi:TniQ
MMKRTTADSLHSRQAKQGRGRLLFRVDPVPFESPLGYLCRVAHAHGYDGPRWLSDLAGIPPGGFELADRGRKLAHALRLDASEWRRLCYMPMGRIERRTFLGQIIGAHQLNYARSRICPGCIRENPT